MPLTLTTADYRKLGLAVLAPPAADDLWTWCSRHLVMHDGKRWEARRAAVYRHWYRVAGARLTGRPDPRDPYAHRCEELYLSVFAQAAKTTLGASVVAFAISNAPRKMAWYASRLKDTNNFRAGRLQRMVMQTRSLAALLPAGEDALQSALGAERWTIGSSMIYWRSGNVADDWRSEDFELVVGDEFDRYDLDVGGMGDPIESGLVRQRRFRKTKLFIGITTPGRPSGHGWRRTCTGSHERPLVDCPHCGAAWWLDWRNVLLADGRDLRDTIPSDILAGRLGRYRCPVNGCLSTSSEISAAIQAFITADRLWCPGAWHVDAHHPEGAWSPHADLDAAGRLRSIPPTESVKRSGHAGALFSLEETVDTIAAKRAMAEQGGAPQRQAFINNDGAEPYVATVNPETSADLAATARSPDGYAHGAVPHAAKWIALFLDQQGNDWSEAWFPYTVRAFDPGGASWLVEAGQARTQEDLARLLLRPWRVGGAARPADVAVMDSANGNCRFQIYLWAAQDPARRILVRGDPRLRDGIPWEEVIDAPNTRRKTPKPAGVREWRLHPTHWRNDLWNRMRRVGAPAPPAWWLPADPPPFYLASMTAEEQVVERRRITGIGWADVVVWRPRVVASTSDAQTYRKDGHWWDGEANLLAVADILGWAKSAPARTVVRRRLV